MNGDIPISFEVVDFFPFKDGFVLAGKCFGGKISVGDVFHKVVKVSQILDEGRPPELLRETLAEIKLEVLEIEYFRRSVTELQDSHSGGLYVRGEGIKFVQKKCDVEI